MKYVVGFVLSLITLFIIIGICHIFNVHHSDYQFLMGWLTCGAYFGGIELYKMIIDETTDNFLNKNDDNEQNNNNDDI